MLQLIELSPHDHLVINAGALFSGINLHSKKNVRIHIWDAKVQLIERQTVNHKRVWQAGRRTVRLFPLIT